ncbi:phosphatidylglycerophosphatase A family protein [Spongorhabdus nitratireducens]
MKAVSLRDLLKNPVHFLAFGLGSGAAPKAPGTFGTLAAVILYLGLQYLPFWNYVLVLAVATVLGIWLCDKTSRDLGVHDHPGIVWDEFVGYWITMLAAPKGWVWIITGFVLFRFFDILKPWPIKVIDQKVHGGFGIMLDDILAGIFSFVVLQLIALAVI